MDLTCRMGLGYPDGPIERVMRGDLARHYDISAALMELSGSASYAPARRAVVAGQRSAAEQGSFATPRLRPHTRNPE